MSASPTVSEIFSVKEWRDLETGGRGRSTKVVENGKTKMVWLPEVEKVW